MQKVRCPYCGCENAAVQYGKDADCAKVTTVCKNKDCRKTFEIKIVKGKQVT